MAVDPLNLVQVQSRLQNPASVTNQDLLKYANGSNPEVPSFLALIEMNRRKQIEDTSAAFDASAKPSIKEQIAQGLTGSGQMMQVNPTNAPVGIVNPTNMQQPAQPTVAPPVADMSAAPQGIDPTQMQAPVQAARGGLMSLPTKHFKASNYAGGGIVAFGDPALNPNEDQVVADRDAEQAKLVAAAKSFPKYYSPQGIQQALAQSGQTLQDEGAAAAVAARNAPPAPPAPSRLEGILAALPKQQDLGVTKPEALTPEQAFENIKKTQQLAGVSADPYAETRKRQDALEARQLAEYERGGIDRLLAQLSAFATADPSKGFGYAAAISSTASRALEKEQNALRTQQETAGIEFQKAMAKEEDAKARGNAAAISSAVEERKKAEVEYAKLIQQNNKIEQDRVQLAITAEHYQNSDEINREKNKITEAYNSGQLTLQEAKNQIDALQAKSSADYYAGKTAYDAKHLKYLMDKEKDAQADRPSAEDKKYNAADKAASADPSIRTLREAVNSAVKSGVMDIDSDEFRNAMGRIQKLTEPYYTSRGLAVPTVPNMPTPPASEKRPPKKGFLESIFGSPVPPTKAVPFDQLPD